MKLSVVMPAHNEEGSTARVVGSLIQTLTAEEIDHEVLVVNDNSTDQTEAILQDLQSLYPTLRYINNEPPNGFGVAIRKGLDEFTGDAVAIVMGDGSDSPKDVVQCFRKLHGGYDCVFGSRFIKGGRVTNYPSHKLLLNRMGNYLIKRLFGLDYNDVTNGFKLYRREVIGACQPLISKHFNINIELPLKAIAQGYKYAVVPISYTDRTAGISKFKIKEISVPYLLTIVYIYLERYFSVLPQRGKGPSPSGADTGSAASSSRSQDFV
jgi:dolichol-phosphate mannosyltransferase